MNESAFSYAYFDKQLNQTRTMYGMTLRDYFAAKAMHGIISGIDPQMNYEEIAVRAYQYADAMMEVREA